MRIPRKRGEPIKETQMISLADIAFLIIFFFLLTSTFLRDRLSVALPFLGKTARTESGVVVTLDREKKIHLNGQPVGSAEALETELKGLLSGKTTPQECEVQFRCDKAMPFKEYRGVYEAISHAGGVIAIMHEVKK